MSWDGAFKRGYVDGVEVNSEPISVGELARPVYIGCEENVGGPDNLMNGALDDVRIYSRALTGAEIAALAQ